MVILLKFLTLEWQKKMTTMYVLMEKTIEMVSGSWSECANPV